AAYIRGSDRAAQNRCNRTVDTGRSRNGSRADRREQSRSSKASLAPARTWTSPSLAWFCVSFLVSVKGLSFLQHIGSFSQSRHCGKFSKVADCCEFVEFAKCVRTLLLRCRSFCRILLPCDHFFVVIPHRSRQKPIRQPAGDARDERGNP